MDTLSDIKRRVTDAMKKVTDAKALEALEIEYLGRRGKLTEILRSLKDKSETERRMIGSAANELKQDLESRFEALKKSMVKESMNFQLRRERIDITAPGVRQQIGGLHPVTLAMREACRIFSGMGFAIAEGPEIETEWNNFDALNIPADHPARDMWDTFWLKSDDKKRNLLLRTHTSPVQIRYMQMHQPPFKMIAPGRVFRYEATDATHDFQFWQLEGLVIGRAVSVANMKSVLAQFFSEFFKADMEIRLRPSFFPFVEPGFEVDVRARGTKHWLEVFGAGMVHPDALRHVGIDPNEWQGFAFGAGFDRLVMMKYKIPDIRHLRGNDIRFLKQFARRK